MTDFLNPASSEKHPLYGQWTEDEKRLRASYLATRKHLVDYLVPHRFESREIDGDPQKLRRSRYGFGFALNRAWLGEMMGHIRSTTARHAWGSMEAVTEGTQRDDVYIVGRPEGGIAQLIWDDATLSGEPMPNFFERRVLEWLLSSVGGFVLVDIQPIETATVGEEMAVGKRPFFRFIPMSRVTDLGTGGSGFGFRWIEVMERVDGRVPGPDGVEGKVEERRILYALQEDGSTLVTRKDTEGQVIDQTPLGVLEDTQGNPVLPLVPAFLGEHPDIDFVGSGLILDLADIVVDLFNRVSETVEGFRDGAFGLHTYAGKQWEDVKQAMEDGSRIVPMGPEDEFARVEGGTGEVEAGLSLIEMDIRAWTLGAKRKAADAMERADQRSGVSMKAEFQLDAKPMLTEIAEKLDQIETNAMWVAAQMAGLTPDESEDIGCRRDTDFQLEDEASRISRIAGEFLAALPLPAEAVKQIILRWLRASNLVDMEDEKISGVVEAQAAEIAEARQANDANRGDLLGFLREADRPAA